MSGVLNQGKINEDSLITRFNWIILAQTLALLCIQCDSINMQTWVKETHFYKLVCSIFLKIYVLKFMSNIRRNRKNLSRDDFLIFVIQIAMLNESPCMQSSNAQRRSYPDCFIFKMNYIDIFLITRAVLSIYKFGLSVCLFVRIQ